MATYEAAGDRSDAAADAHSDELSRIECLILFTPAATPAGALVQLRVIGELWALYAPEGIYVDKREITGLRNAIATLAGRAPA